MKTTGHILQTKVSPTAHRLHETFSSPWELKKQYVPSGWAAKQSESSCILASRWIGADREARWHPSSPSGWLPLSWPPHGASIPALVRRACKLVALPYLGALPCFGGSQWQTACQEKKKWESGETWLHTRDKVRRMESEMYYRRKVKPVTYISWSI